jgi:tetratricopeptide (TPR) repeat protein
VHFERARAASRSIRYRCLAAEQALQRCAFPEAIEHLTSARSLLDRVPDARERVALELDVLTILGPALYSALGPADPEVETVYLRARGLAEQAGEATRLYPALFGLWYVHYGRGEYPPARELGEKLLALAQKEGDTGRLLEAHHALWPTVFAMGEPTTARMHLERGLGLYDPAHHQAQISLYGGHDTGVCCRNHLSITWWLLGYPDRALAALAEALARAERLAHPMTTTVVLNFAPWLHLFRGEHAACRMHAERLVTLAAAQESPTYIAEGRAAMAVLDMLGRRDRRRLAELYETLCGLQETRTVWRSVASFCVLAEIAAEIDEPDLGFTALDAIAAPHRDAFFAPEIHRVRGALVLRRDGPAEAEPWLRRALDVARARSERALELRAATSLARLLVRLGRHAEARETLGAVYGWFTEGLDTADLRAARALLDDLEGAAAPRGGRRGPVPGSGRGAPGAPTPRPASS